ncbi:MAG: SDR family oxidoreductase [Pseudomonadota bacterium]
MSLPRTPSLRLDGRSALVTGGSSGIGLGAAVALAERGAHVVCAARGADRLNGAVAEMTQAGLSAEALVLDVGEPEAVAAACGSGAAPFDIVVNAAGLARHSAAIETQPADYDAVMGINLRGAYFLSARAAEALMQAGKPGSIIHISSQMGHVGGVDRALYCASKHGLEGMVKAMAIEWGRAKIRINTLCPTFIRTPLTEQTFERPERVRWIEEKIKLGRVGEVEDIMGAVVYLASDASALVTGTALLIDGGWTAD